MHLVHSEASQTRTPKPMKSLWGSCSCQFNLRIHSAHCLVSINTLGREKQGLGSNVRKKRLDQERGGEFLV